MTTSASTPTGTTGPVKLRRGWRVRCAAVAGAAAAVVGLTSLPAQASLWTSPDNFDQASSWQATKVGIGSASVISFGVAGSDPGAGNVGQITSRGSGYASLGRTWHLQPVPYHTSQCGAQILLRPASVAVTANVEVINPKSWTYVGLKTITLPAWSSWTAVKVDPWVNGPADVYFRVSLAGANTATDHTVYVDNALVACGY